jgi:hypothetical protein
MNESLKSKNSFFTYLLICLIISYCIITLLYVLRIIIPLGEYTGLYFYSSVFQGNMALLALVGVFAIYKLQQIHNNIAEIKKFVIQYILSFVMIYLTNLI